MSHLHILLDMALRFGRQVECGIRIELPIKHHDFAALIVASRSRTTGHVQRFVELLSTQISVNHSILVSERELRIYVASLVDDQGERRPDTVEL